MLISLVRGFNSSHDFSSGAQQMNIRSGWQLNNHWRNESTSTREKLVPLLSCAFAVFSSIFLCLIHEVWSVNFHVQISWATAPTHHTGNFGMMWAEHRYREQQTREQDFTAWMRKSRVSPTCYCRLFLLMFFRAYTYDPVEGIKTFSIAELFGRRSGRLDLDFHSQALRRLILSHDGNEILIKLSA